MPSVLDSLSGRRIVEANQLNLANLRQDGTHCELKIFGDISARGNGNDRDLSMCGRL